MNAYVRIIDGKRVKITVKGYGHKFVAVRKLHVRNRTATARLRVA